MKTDIMLTEALDAYIRDRRKQGLATRKQVQWLISAGVDPKAAIAMTFAEAVEMIDQIFGRRSKTP